LDLRSQQQQSFTLGVPVYCHFFASPSTRPAETMFPPVSVRNGNMGIFFTMAKKKPDIFSSVVFLLTAFSNIRTAICFEYSKNRQTKISYR
jgi:hypothetical protein